MNPPMPVLGVGERPEHPVTVHLQLPSMRCQQISCQPPARLPFCRTRRFHPVHTPPSFRAPRCMHYRLPGRSARQIVPQQLETTLEG